MNFQKKTVNYFVSTYVKYVLCIFILNKLYKESIVYCTNDDIHKT